MKKERIAASICNLRWEKALETTFNRFGLKKEQVANAAFMNVRNIYRYLNGIIPQKKSLVQLLIAMELPLEVSLALIHAAGYSLSASSADVFYRTLLENPKAVNVLEANEMIEEYNRQVGKNAIPLFKLN